MLNVGLFANSNPIEFETSSGTLWQHPPSPDYSSGSTSFKGGLTIALPSFVSR